MTACSFCGVPADLGTAPAAGRARLDLDAAVCAGCMTLDPARPGAALRAAARLLGADEDDPHLREALLDEDGALDGLLYDDPGDPLSSGYRAPQRAPWVHVSRQTWAALGRARDRAEGRRAAEAGGGPAGESPPPSGPPACLVCGVGASTSWRPVTTAALARGRGMLDGHLCGGCAEVLAAVGAVGPTLVERAYSEARGQRWTEATRVPGLTAWAATDAPPGEPWSWAAPRREGPAPGSVEAQVADLRAQVAALAEGAAR